MRDSSTKEVGAVVLVDPYSTGQVLFNELIARGTNVVCLWSAVYLSSRALKPVGNLSAALAILHESPDCPIVDVIKDIRFYIQNIFLGGDTGVMLAFDLCVALQLPCFTKNRETLKNKYEQIEAVRRSGLSACVQKITSNELGVHEFLLSHQPDPFVAIVKPLDSAASDGVSICSSPESLVSKTTSLLGTMTTHGNVNRFVLLQEYLDGDEYVVNTVSRNGEHKCIDMVKYDKRIYMGQHNMYFGSFTLDINSEPHAQKIMQYARNVCTAIGMQTGPVHMEIILVRGNPVLVECNVRLAGAGGSWVAKHVAIKGYSQLQAYLDAVLNAPAFDKLSSEVATSNLRGATAWVRTPAAGIFDGLTQEALAKIRTLPSFFSDTLASLQIGLQISASTCINTIHGSITLISSSFLDLQRDYQYVQSIIDGGLIKIRTS